ncbi:MAG: amino acid adenylation domain-containing protein [Methanobrevibacter sp.]|jgi:amino acid adenylation domain-containing protein|nr:amino acid adenylation domain-containing protein [Candidatus Methanovirga australis]
MKLNCPDTIIDIFNHQVKNNKNKIAIVFNDVELTYKELNQKANKIANYLLLNHKITADTLIPLFLSRSEYMVIAILAVLKTGAAYVPISPSFPKNRVKHILNDTKSEIILTDETNHNTISGMKIQQTVYILENILKKEGLVESNPNIEYQVNSLAYVIYTSGTTGMPKGVMIEHHSVVNLIKSNTTKYGFKNSGEDVLLFFANYVFDISVEQIFLALLNGYKLIISPDDLWMDEKKFIDYSNKNKVTYINLTPSFLDAFNVISVKTLQILNSVGEALTQRIIDKLSNQDFLFINSYGPTETTVVSIVNVGVDENSIGKPIDNTTAYILDENNNIVPVGSVGELHIGGLGLARGYLNNEKLTNEKFIQNPYQNEKQKNLGFNDKLYKTGDLVRLNENNNFEYIGRKDFQVKIRGYRVELGEIENTILKSFNEIKRALVVFNDNSQLVAYYLSDISIDKKLIKRALSDFLPDFMIPTYYCHLNEFPLNNSGKIDRTKLPKPSLTINGNFIQPNTPMERSLFDLCVNILGYDNFGITNDFFSIGFNSLFFIKLVNQIFENYNVNLDVVSLLKNGGTIKDLSKKIENSTIVNSHEYDIQNVYPLSPNQIYHLTDDNNSTDVDGLNGLNMTFYVKFSAKKYDVHKLRDVLIEIINMNSYLKAHAFITPKLEIFIKRNDDYIVDIEIHDKKLTEEVIKEFYNVSFDIFKSPLFKFEFYHDNQDIFLLICIHHAVFDYESIYVLLDDLIRKYNGENLLKQYDYFDYTLDYSKYNPKISKMKLISMAKEILFSKLKNLFKLSTTNKKSNINLFSFNIKMNSEIKVYCDNYKLTNNDFIFNILLMGLRRFLAFNEILIDYNFNGHEDPKYGNTIGLFVRRLKLFINLMDKSFSQLSDHVKEVLYSQIHLNNSSFEKVNNSQDVHIKYNYFGDYLTRNKELNITDIKGTEMFRINKNILWFEIAENEDNEIRITLTYNTDYYSSKDIGKLHEYFLDILNKF